MVARSTTEATAAETSGRVACTSGIGSLTCFIATPTWVSAMEGDVAGEHLVEDDAERVDVGALVDVLAHRLLGGDVVGGAEHPAGRGHPLLLERAGDAEVGHLRAPVGVDQDVLRLDVAVDEPAGMGAVEAAPDLDRVGDRLVDRQRPLPWIRSLQRAALDVLEDDVGAAVVLARVDDPDEVGMREPRRRPGLAAEALELVGLSEISRWSSLTATGRSRTSSSAR